MDLNLTQPIILNATLIQPSGASNNTLMAAFIGASSALIASIVTNIMHYYIEKRKLENEMRLQLRRERKKLYINLFISLNNIKDRYKHITNFRFDMNTIINSDDLAQMIRDVESEIDPFRSEIYSVIEKFRPEIGMIGNLYIINLLELIYNSTSPQQFERTITTSENQNTSDKGLFNIFEDVTHTFSEIEDITRSELVPIPEKTMRNKWQFWK